MTFLPLLLLSLIQVCLSQSSVPLLAWSTQSLSCSCSSSVATVCDATIAVHTLLASVGHNSVLLGFVKPQLSVEEFTLNKNKYTATQHACNSAKHSIYVPHVEASQPLATVVVDLANSAAVPVMQLIPEEALQLTQLATPAVIIIRLSEDAAESIIHNTIEHIKTLAPTANLTNVVTGDSQSSEITDRLSSATASQPKYTEAVARRSAAGSSGYGVPSLSRVPSAPAPPVVSPQPPIRPYASARPDQRNEQANVYFPIPILMGIMVGVFMIIVMFVGVAGLSHTQTMERWPDANHDKNLIVPQ